MVKPKAEYLSSVFEKKLKEALKVFAEGVVDPKSLLVDETIVWKTTKEEKVSFISKLETNSPVKHSCSVFGTNYRLILTSHSKSTYVSQENAEICGT